MESEINEDDGESEGESDLFACLRRNRNDPSNINLVFEKQVTIRGIFLFNRSDDLLNIQNDLRVGTVIFTPISMFKGGWLEIECRMMQKPWDYPEDVYLECCCTVKVTNETRRRLLKVINGLIANPNESYELLNKTPVLIDRFGNFKRTRLSRREATNELKVLFDYFKE